jgi:hypothetical protein
MATVPVTINGVIFPKGRSADDRPIPCTIVGEAWVSDLSVGGGPVFPPPQPGGGVPIHPIWGPPGIDLPPGPGFPPVAGHPLPPIPPDQIPPDLPPVPPPGSPPVIIPGTHPTQPIVPPAFVVVDYPGIGKVVVPQPLPPSS